MSIAFLRIINKKSEIELFRNIAYSIRIDEILRDKSDKVNE